MCGTYDRQLLTDTAAWLYSPTEEDEALLFTTALAGEKQVSFPVHPLLLQGKVPSMSGKEPGASAVGPCFLCCRACSLGECVRKAGRENCSLALSAAGITFQKQHWKKQWGFKRSWHQNQEQVECWYFTTWFNYYFLPARSCWSAVSLHDKT